MKGNVKKTEVTVKERMQFSRKLNSPLLNLGPEHSKQALEIWNAILFYMGLKGKNPFSQMMAAEVIMHTGIHKYQPTSLTLSARSSATRFIASCASRLPTTPPNL